MVSWILLRKMRRDLMTRKLALAALVAIVAVGVGTFVATASVYRDLDGARQRYYDRYRLPDFTVDLKRAPEWTVDLAEALPNVDHVRGRVSQGLLVDLPGRLEPLPGLALSMPGRRGAVLGDILMRRGTWFSHADAKEVILNDQFATAHRLAPGSRILVRLLDKQHDVLVVGTAMSPEHVYLVPPGGGMAPDPGAYGVMYLPRKFLQESCDLDGAYNQLVGKAFDRSRVALDHTLEALEDKLDAYGVTNTTPLHDQPSVRMLADELKGVKVSTTVFPVIFLGVAALVLNILMGRLVAQQRTVIGTLKAVGYSSGAVVRHYLCYGVVIGATGGLLGVGLGVLMRQGMLVMYRNVFAIPSIPAGFYPDVLATGVAIAVVFAVLGTLKGVRSSAKLAPAEAMQPPPPEKGARVLVERIPFLWNRLPFRWKMVLRAIFRNPFRSTVTLLASVIATALVVANFSLLDSLFYLMDYQFKRIAHQDLTVSLREPAAPEALAELAGMPTVAQTEPQLSVVCDMQNGPYKKRLGITALPANNRLHTPLDAHGDPVVIPDQGVILTRKVAQILHVTAGDCIVLRPLIARREQVIAPVVGVVDTYLGLSAYCGIEYLSRRLGEDRVVNALLAASFAGSSNTAFMTDLKRRPTVIGLARRTRALEQLQEMMNKAMGSMMTIMVLFSGIIAFGSVLNAALVSLGERQREVGTLRVLGYSPAQVTEIFAGESLLVNGVGIGLGVLGGVGLSALLCLVYNTEMYRFPLVVYPSRLVFGAVLMALFVGAAQCVIYRLIRRMNWLDVLKIKE